MPSSDARLVNYPYQNSESISDRWNAIFEDIEIIDPCMGGGIPRKFHLQAKEIISLAQKHPPKIRKATVSSFSDWIYSLYTKAPDPVILDSGKKMERHIFSARHRLFREKSFRYSAPTGYDLFHSDLRDPLMQGGTHFEIPSLRVDGVTVNASPDLIYINRNDKRSAIIEVKYSNKPIPLNLWPNVWAQLWAYSKIPIIDRSPSVIVAAEVWGGDERMLHLRRTVKKNPRDKRFDDFFTELFKIYASS